MRPRIATAVLIAVIAAAAGCGGDSAEEKAQASVCEARAGISEEVDKLQGMTLGTATTSEIKNGLTAIRDDLATIDKAQADLNDERKSELRKANDAFETQVRELASSLGTTTSLSDAKTQLGDALDQLAATYEDTLATFDCGG